MLRPVKQGTTVIPNLTSVLSDKEHWKFPKEFNPENFLNEKGELVKPEAFIPFSLGKWKYLTYRLILWEAWFIEDHEFDMRIFYIIGPRTCLGEGLARMELFLILVTLFKRFKFIWPEDAGEPDLTPVYGVTQTPKAYRMIVKFR